MRVDVRPVTAWMTDIQKQQLPYASALALTRTAQYARRQVIAEMRRDFDRPKPITVNEERGPLYLKTASYKRANDYAEVRIKDTSFKSDPPLAWLSPEVRGGARIEKRSEYLLRKAGLLPNGYYAVPGAGARMDKYGNMSTGQVQQILAALGGSRDTQQNASVRSKARNKAIGTYFLASRTRRATSHLAEGVWQRSGLATVKPVLVFVKGAPRYRKRISFFETCDQVARFRFPIEFHVAMKQAIATARVVPSAPTR